jgi:HAMP domain-containing protein
MKEHTAMSNPIDAGCSEMVSNDVVVDGESVSIDPDIPRRDWNPVLRNPSLTPPPESLVESESARLVAVPNRSPLASELLIEEQQAEIVKLRSAMQAMKIQQNETMETVAVGQAEIEELRTALGAMTTAVTNDASKLTIEQLEKMNALEFNRLHFSNCELSVLDEVFKKRGKYGDLDPPAEYRETAKTMRAWRQLGMRQQRSKIDACKQRLHR